jgi:hypothetical protein
MTPESRRFAGATSALVERGGRIFLGFFAYSNAQPILQSADIGGTVQKSVPRGEENVMKRFTRGNRPQPIARDQGRDAGDDPKAERETRAGEALAGGADNDPAAVEATPEPVERPPLPDHAQDDVTATQWKLTTRVAFRFCFVYFGLFCLGTQILGALLGTRFTREFLPVTAIGWIQLFPPREWVAVHVFHLDAASMAVPSGSGDRAFDWVSLLCWLVLAVVATVIWSVLDRRRTNYVTLHKWFRVFIRFCLAGQMISYGAAKAFPTQMPFPSLDTLVQPFGTFSPMGVLWSQVGSSPPYEIALGCVEILAGVLLILPRTTTLGALVSAAAAGQIFLLNMTYDVPVKIFSFHLVLLSLVLLAPEAPRLAKFFLSSKPVSPPTQPQLFGTRRANRIALVVQIVFGVWILVPPLLDGRDQYNQWGAGRARPPLYGIWNVAEFTMDGQTHPPLLTDKERWQRVIFDYPERVTFQRMNDSFASTAATVDTEHQRIELTNPRDNSRIATFTFTQPAADRLALDGELNGRKVHTLLERLDANTFTLVNRGFHWVQEAPFNG